MAGILANSVSKTMVSGDTSVDGSSDGYITQEQIVLTAYPAGSVYQWGLAKPEGSTARCEISDDSASAPTLVPDVAGDYVVTADVDGDAYVIRINVTQVAITTAYEAIRLSPKSDASVPVPALGCALYWSSDQNALALKDAAGSVFTVDVTAVP